MAKRSKGGRSQTSFQILSSITGALLSTTSLMYIATYLGPEVLGTYGYVLALMGLVTFASDIGLSAAHRNVLKSEKEIGQANASFIVVKLVFLGIMAILGLTLIELWKLGLINGEMEINSYTLMAMYVILIYYIISGLSSIPTTTFIARNEIAKSQVPGLIEHLIRVSLIVYVAISISGSYPGVVLLLAYITMGASLIALAMYSILFLSCPIKRPTWDFIKKYLGLSSPILVVSIVGSMNLYLDKVLIGYFWGPYETGLYFGVQRMSVFVMTFSFSIGLMIIPPITAYFRSPKDTDTEIRRIVNFAERYTSLVVLPIVVFYIVFGRDIIRVFLSDSFLPAYRTMTILVLSGLVVAYTQPFRALVAGTNLKLVNRISAASLFTGVILYFILIPISFGGVAMKGEGGVGAATATLIASLLPLIAFRGIAWKENRIVPDRRIAIHITAAFIMAGTLIALKILLFHPLTSTSLILMSILGGIIYAAILYKAGELSRREMRTFKELLNPEMALSYVASELLGR